MKKETVLLVIVTLVVVGLIGAVVSNKPAKSKDDGRHETHAAANVDLQKNIQVLKDILKTEPDNRNAWVQLGNKFFDTNQLMNAIEAYDNALAIDRNDPNVLTDQGIMFRRIGWYQKALENFSEANQINPQHPQSLLNMGVVYNSDLGEKEKAKEAWLKYLEIDSTSSTAERVRTMIDHMENGHG